MKKTIPFALVFLIFITLLACKKDVNVPPPDNGISFEKTFGGNMDDDANSLVYSNQHLFILGTTKSFGDTLGDFYLVKMDMNGNLIWEKALGTNGADEGVRIKTTSDGNLILLGRTRAAGSANRDFYLVKVNHQGDILWEKTYGGANDDLANDVLEMPEGGFLLLGGTQSYNFGVVDIYLVKTDASGNEVNYHVYGGASVEIGTKILPTADGQYMIYGFTHTYSVGDRDLYLVKIKPNGDTLFTKSFGGIGYEESQGFAALKEGGYIICAHSASIDPNHNLYGIRITEDGSTIWEKNFGGDLHDGGQAVMQDSKGNIVLVGVSNSFSGSQDIYVITVDPDGNIISETTYGGNMDEMSYDILIRGNSHYIVGKTNSYGAGGYDMFVVKSATF